MSTSLSNVLSLYVPTVSLLRRSYWCHWCNQTFLKLLFYSCTLDCCFHCVLNLFQKQREEIKLHGCPSSGVSHLVVQCIKTDERHVVPLHVISDSESDWWRKKRGITYFSLHRVSISFATISLQMRVIEKHVSLLLLRLAFELSLKIHQYETTKIGIHWNDSHKHVS